MAKRKAQNIKKKKIDFLQSIKSMTKWITNPQRTEEQLVELIDKYKIKNYVVKRILSYNYGFPHIIKYFNTYMNNLYEFDSYDTRLLVKSLVYVMDINNRSNSKNFMFLKSSELRDEIKKTIKDLIKDYLSTVHKIECNRRDLDIYYKLFKTGVIKDEDLLEIDRLMNGDKPLIKSLSFINYSEAIQVQDPDENSEEILNIGEKKLDLKVVQFINEIKDLKDSTETCKTCKLFKKQMVVLDTNKKDLGDTDIIFVGLNPGSSDVESELPFTDVGGIQIRQIVNQLPRETTWTLFNAILCATQNKKEITALSSVDDIIRNCLPITGKIFENFSSKLYIPIGNEAKMIFGITDKITAASGKVYALKNDVNVIPLMSPNSITHNAKNKSIYEKSVKNIIEFITPTASKGKPNLKTKPTEITHRNLVEDEKGLLLLDVKRLEKNQLLMIYTDHAGEKKYIIKNYSFPILIRNKEWSECDMITDKIHESCQLSDYEKSMISKKCHQMLNQMVKI